MLFNIIFVFLRIYAFQSGHVAMFKPAMSSRDLQLNFSAFTVIEIHFFTSLYTSSTSYVLGTTFENMVYTYAQTHTYVRMLARTLARTHARTHAHTHTHARTKRTHDVHACYVYACMFSLNIPVVSLPSIYRSRRVASVRHQPEQGRAGNCVPHLRRWLRSARDDAV